MMGMPMRRVGLDVHARETAAAVLEPEKRRDQRSDVERSPVDGIAVAGDAAAAVPGGVGAGPTCDGLARAAQARGLDLVVRAPVHVVRSMLDRVKADNRDAIQLARPLLAGEPALVRVPEPTEEQLGISCMHVRTCTSS